MSGANRRCDVGSSKRDLHCVIEKLEGKIESRMDRLETRIAALQSVLQTHTETILYECSTRTSFNEETKQQSNGPAEPSDEQNRTDGWNTMKFTSEVRSVDVLAHPARSSSGTAALHAETGRSCSPTYTIISSDLVFSNPTATSPAMLPEQALQTPIHPTECARETGPDMSLTEGDHEENAARSQRIASGRDLLQDGRHGSGFDSDGSSSSSEGEDGGADAPDGRSGRRRPGLLRRRGRARCDLRAARDAVLGDPNVSSPPRGGGKGRGGEATARAPAPAGLGAECLRAGVPKAGRGREGTLAMPRGPRGRGPGLRR
jgi:hypothetical protein